MNSIVIDSDILIDHLRGFQLATDFLSRVFQGEFTGYISVLTEMELLAGTMPKKNEKEMVENLLKRFSPVPVSSNIARRAGELLRKYRINGLVPVDAIIASTALELKAILVTKNTKHFDLIDGLLSLKPYHPTVARDPGD
ncbi:type II toxin-antitoxin system VapC family toxin [Neomoorella mulderi]|uniref:Ribonuclease VapC19 n=1 Tax=Moorella mulderi DSM 14980 TaxID=1122241 RepID=A0A151AU76_9FIRM|nr:type II toxin-antitoxin system VapC family toxin [Moorella mulderi]KYH31206.1 ribonuclease VapC19 [Moorella mulderi DSM 14980]